MIIKLPFSHCQDLKKRPSTAQRDEAHRGGCQPFPNNSSRQVCGPLHENGLRRRKIGKGNSSSDYRGKNGSLESNESATVLAERRFGSVMFRRAGAEFMVFVRLPMEVGTARGA